MRATHPGLTASESRLPAALAGNHRCNGPVSGILVHCQTVPPPAATRNEIRQTWGFSR